MVGGRFRRTGGRAISGAAPTSLDRSVMRAAALILLLVLLLTGCMTTALAPAPQRPPLGTTYYVSRSGSDDRPGTSPEAAWATVTKVNAAHFGPGDRVLFEAGATFDGGLSFGPDDRGSAEAPITVRSYGAGRATLVAREGNGLYAENTAGLVIRDLRFRGPGRASGRSAGTDVFDAGINLFNNMRGNVKLAFVRILGVDVRGFDHGIAIGGWSGASGFRDVRIEDSVSAENRRAGVGFYGEKLYANEDVAVVRTVAFGNSGTPGLTRNSGNGIVLGSVDRGLVERSVAYGNGWLCDTPEGPVGIWAYDSRAVVIRHNLSFNNRTGGRADGGGFDLDGGVTDSVMEYNQSFGNDGAGYGLYQYPGAPPWGNNIVRHNTSVDDGRKNGYGAITLWSGGSALGDVEISGNLIVQSGETTTDAIQFRTPAAGARLRDNVVAGAARTELPSGYPDGS
jgi:hypothetical protein